MKIMPPEIEVRFMKIMLGRNRSWIDDYPTCMSRFPLAHKLASKRPTSKRPGAQASCVWQGILFEVFHPIVGPAT